MADTINGHADIQFAEGRILAFSCLFALAPFEVSPLIPQQLELDMYQGPLGSTITTGALKETSMPGVFPCGDAARPIASVALAVGGGNLASVGGSLMFGSITHE